MHHIQEFRSKNSDAPDFNKKKEGHCHRNHWNKAWGPAM